MSVSSWCSRLLSLSAAGKLLGCASLADAGLTHEHYELAVACECLAQGSRQRAHLQVSPYEWLRVRGWSTPRGLQTTGHSASVDTKVRRDGAYTFALLAEGMYRKYEMIAVHVSGPSMDATLYLAGCLRGVTTRDRRVTRV